MIERAAKMADWLRGTYGYSPEMNAKCVQLLKDMVGEMERLKAERDALKTDMQAVLHACEFAFKIMREHEQVKRTMSNDNVRAILDEIRALKREAKEFAASDYRTGYLSALSALEGFIAGIPTVGVPQWISVKDRLPSGFDYFDDGTYEPAEYIVKVKNAEVATIAMFDGNEWIPAQYNGITEDRWFVGPVTHWMPLPAPPEGTNNG